MGPFTFLVNLSNSIPRQDYYSTLLVKSVSIRLYCEGRVKSIVWDLGWVFFPGFGEAEVGKS
jgi:hypothetical protein